MRGLNDGELVAIWEGGRARPAWYRALLPIAAIVGAPVDELANWPLGRRDGWLLAVRAWTLGPTLEATCTCPAERCGAALEVPLRVADLLDAWPPDEAPEAAVVATGDVMLTLRAPVSRDFAGPGAAGLSAAGLFRRCLLDARRDGPEGPATEPVDLGDLPDGAVAAAEEAIAGLDPLAEIAIALTCPDCGAAWDEPLDVASYVWAELETAARAVLVDVHVLASAYGWTEGEVLGLGRDRRTFYRDLIAAGRG
jgi:hypothetical protein